MRHHVRVPTIDMAALVVSLSIALCVLALPWAVWGMQPRTLEPPPPSLWRLMVAFWPLTMLAPPLLLVAAWQLAGAVVIDVDAQRVRATLWPRGRRLVVPLTAIERIDTVEHVVPWYELRTYVRHDRERQQLRVTWDLRIVGADGNATVLPVRRAAERAQALATELSRAVDDARQPRGYRG